MSKSFASLLSSFKAAPKQTDAVASESKSAKLEIASVPSFSKPWGRVQEFLSLYKDNSVGDEDYRRSADTKEIALLFIIQKDLPNELLWRLWIERIESSNHRVRVWIHAKEPSAIQSRWIQDRLVRRFQLRPSWGSLELTKTMVCLLFEAYVDCPTTDMFLFVSESCIPFCSATKVFSTLFSNSMTPSSTSSSSSSSSSSPSGGTTASTVVGLKSWLKYRDTPNNGYSRMQQFDILKDKIPAEHILKSDQWVAICHAHARKLFQCLHYLAIPPSPPPPPPPPFVASSRDTVETSAPPPKDADSDPRSAGSSSSVTNTTNHDRFMRELTFSHIQNSVLFTLFQGMKASDEMFFATTLSMLQCRSQIEPRRWTYAEWEGQAASPLLFQAAELMKNLPSFEDLRDSTFSSSSSSSSSSAPASSSSSSSATDKMTTMQYTLPAERHLHPNLRRAMTEDTLFLRKLRWESLTYYRDLPASASSRDRPRQQREAEEVQALLAYGPVQASLNLVQRWWLFVHRSELQEILRTGRRADDGRDPLAALREYWQRYCIPIVENVLYFNRARDEWHTPLDRLDDDVEATATATAVVAAVAAIAEREDGHGGKRPRLDDVPAVGDGVGAMRNGDSNIGGSDAVGDADGNADGDADGDESTGAKRARR